MLRTATGPSDDTVACTTTITARHLLTSTSGHGFATVDTPVVPLLVEQLGQASMDVAAVPPPDEWMRRLADIPLIHQTREGWTYNASHDVLGVLLARAAGQDLADLMAERLLESLGMVDSGFHVPAGRRARFTTLYGHEQGSLRVSDEPDGAFAEPPACASGAGGIVTTADDLLAFGRMLLAAGDVVLAPESVRLMTIDHTTPAQRAMGGFFLDGQGWGFGGGVDTEARQPWNVVGRDGWVGGTGTAVHVYPRHRTATSGPRRCGSGSVASVVGGPGTLAAMTIRTGTSVTWTWGSSHAEGTVTEVHHDTVTRTTKGNEVTRNGSDDDPAYVIEQEDGTTVLKLSSEVERAG